MWGVDDHGIWRFGIVPFNIWLRGIMMWKWGIVLDQAESWVLRLISGIDYHGLHVFCIFSMKIPLLGMEMVKLNQEEEPWSCHVCFHSVKSLFL